MTKSQVREEAQMGRLPGRTQKKGTLMPQQLDFPPESLFLVVGLKAVCVVDVSF